MFSHNKNRKGWKTISTIILAILTFSFTFVSCDPEPYVQQIKPDQTRHPDDITAEVDVVSILDAYLKDNSIQGITAEVSSFNADSGTVIIVLILSDYKAQEGSAAVTGSIEYVLKASETTTMGRYDITGFTADGSLSIVPSGESIGSSIVLKDITAKQKNALKAQVSIDGTSVSSTNFASRIIEDINASSTTIVDGKEVSSAVALGFARGGSGTPSDPYQIASAKNLTKLAEVINNKVIEAGEEGFNIKLVEDIDFTGLQWTSIGTYSIPYVGVFEGNGKSISGVTGNLFTSAGTAGIATEIRNLTINGNITGSFSSGVLVGTAKGSITIDSCVSNVNVDSTGYGNIAAFIGAASGLPELRIMNSVNNGDISTPNGKAAGFYAGRTSVSGPVYIENCKNYGNISAGGENASGFVLTAKDVTIKGCENYGNITGRDYSAGIQGYAGGVVNITDCSNFGDVGSETSQYSGGIFARGSEANPAPVMEYCINKGNITGTTFVGGITAAGGTVINSSNEGNVTATGSAGGIVGYSANVSDSTNTGSISGKYAGGIAAQSYNSTLINNNGGSAEIKATEDGAAGRLIGIVDPSYKATLYIGAESGNIDSSLGMIGKVKGYLDVKKGNLIAGQIPVEGNSTIELFDGASWATPAGELLFKAEGTNLKLRFTNGAWAITK